MGSQEILAAYGEAKEKLEKILDEYDWDIEVWCKDYPITYTFRKAQMQIGATCEEPPEIKFIFRSNLEYVLSVPEDERIDETFFTKLKNAAKEMHRLYLMTWFAQKNERLQKHWKVMWKTSCGCYVGILDEGYEP